jgi:excisionase family DNA binding protein
MPVTAAMTKKMTIRHANDRAEDHQRLAIAADHYPGNISPPADQIAMTGHALTADELGMLLTISRATIFRMAKAGRIPSFRVGTCVRFDPCVVAKWLCTQ